MLGKKSNCNFYYSLLGIETLVFPMLVSVATDCNFYYSLLGIETQINKRLCSFFKLQFLLLPIRDWNPCVPLLMVLSRILQFLLLPIRDWNKRLNSSPVLKTELELQFLLLPIRDWNKTIAGDYSESGLRLQFLLLPIRDWNNSLRFESITDRIAISITPY